MILLDTMVIVEPLRAVPNQRVIAWLNSQLAETVCVASLSIAEVLRAVERLSAGRREVARTLKIGERLIELFEGRIIPFDITAARPILRSSSRCGALVTASPATAASLPRLPRCIIASWPAERQCHSPMPGCTPRTPGNSEMETRSEARMG